MGLPRAEQSPSPVTETPVRESAWPGVTTAAAWGPEHLQHLLLIAVVIFKQFFNTTAAALVVQLQLQLQFCICSLYFESHDSDCSKPCPC